MKDLILNALGKDINSPQVKSILFSIDEKPVIYKPDKSIPYEANYGKEYSFEKYGIVIMFDVEDRCESFSIRYLAKNGVTLCLIDLNFHDINSTTTKRNILNIFGKPTRCGGGGASILFSKVPIWFLYNIGEYWLRFSFAANETETIDDIIFMLPESVPKKPTPSDKIVIDALSKSLRGS